MTRPPDPRIRALRLSRTVLVSDLVAGACWLVPLLAGSWPLVVIGAGYVVVASLWFARMAAIPGPSGRRRRLMAAVPWAAAVVVWATLVASVGAQNDDPDHVLALVVGGLIGTLCFVGWQLLALALRQLAGGRDLGPARS